MLSLTILTPERTIYSGHVSQVTVPTDAGEITILANHMALISTISAGELVFHGEKGIVPMAVSGGFVRVEDNEITILADTAERAHDIMEDRAEEARWRAIQAREEKRFNSEEYAILSAKIEKEVARLRVVKKYRHKGHAGLTEPEITSIQE